MKKLLGFFLKLFTVVAVIVALVLLAFYSRYQSAIDTAISDSTEKVEFVVESGDTADQIIEALAQEGLIDEDITTYLKIYFRFSNLAAIQQGMFSIPKDLTPIEILATLEEPESTDIWVTVQEGLRKDEIADIFTAEFGADNFSKDRFLTLTTDTEFINNLDLGVVGLTNLEGYLFPDRYRLAADSTEEEIIEIMVLNLMEKVGTMPTYEQVIIASMVEREGRTDTDRPMIADIIMRRDEEGWLLQIDATLLYYHKDWRHVITSEDKTIDHSYNTYLKVGLPSTPISNPGVAAIEATITPTPNTYYYYIHDNDGVAHFATTLYEHEVNVNEYLR